MITELFVDGQSVELSLSYQAKLMAHYIGCGNGALVPNGSRGVVASVLDVLSRDTLAAVKFDDFEHELVIPTKYLKAC